MYDKYTLKARPTKNFQQTCLDMSVARNNLLQEHKKKQLKEVKK